MLIPWFLSELSLVVLVLVIVVVVVVVVVVTVPLSYIFPFKVIFKRYIPCEMPAGPWSNKTRSSVGQLVKGDKPFLCPFAKLRKATISLVMFVPLSVHPHETPLPPDGCRKPVVEIKLSLISDKNNGYFAWRRLYIYENNLLNSS